MNGLVKPPSMRHRVRSTSATSALPEIVFTDGNDKSPQNKSRNGRILSSKQRRLAIALFICICFIFFTMDTGGVGIETFADLVEQLDANSFIPSTDDTVIGIGADYDIATYKQFVGSLRKSGFKGNIILGLGDTRIHSKDEITLYLDAQGVTLKKIRTTPCKYNPKQTCLDTNSNFKPGWASYSLARNWLRECEACRGSTMLVSIQNTFFQNTPFYDNTILGKEGLHLFETPLTTENWRVAMPLRKCKKFQWDVPLISSSVMMGDRMSILFYLETIIGEMHKWNKKDECQSNLCGDEMAIQNYLFYNGDLRATVHDSSYGLVNFVPKAGFGKLHRDDSAAVVALDGVGEEFYAWIEKHPFMGEMPTSIASIRRVQSSPLQDMVMEHFSLEDKTSLTEYADKIRRRGVI